MLSDLKFCHDIYLDILTLNQNLTGVTLFSLSELKAMVSNRFSSYFISSAFTIHLILFTHGIAPFNGRSICAISLWCITQLIQDLCIHSQSLGSYGYEFVWFPKGLH